MTTPMPLLLVDDEAGIRTTLSILLEDLGYRVSTACSGEDALEVFARLKPRLVISDVKMPGMDGLALLKALKGQFPKTEVLMLTGHGDMDLAVESLRLGAGDFLTKPIAAEALEVALERARTRLSMQDQLHMYTTHLEELVAKRTHELLQTERFAAVGETAAGLAHAIKNIAGALEGTMLVLERGLELNKREYVEEGWRMVRSDVSRLHSLAVDLLHLGKPSQPRFSMSCPDVLVHQVLTLLETKIIAAGVTVERLCNAGPEPFMMDTETVHRCLLNLTLNALEACAYSKPGCGYIQITATQQTGQDGKREIVYTVLDNGPGMMDWQAGSKTTSFISLKDEGNGIGLFITRKEAHEMGAELAFEQTKEGLTKATLTLKEPKNTPIIG